MTNSFHGNRNKAPITVSCSNAINYCFVGGLIGAFPQNVKTDLYDSSNYGNVTNNCVSSLSKHAACGLMCSDENANSASMYNCLNKGCVEGQKAYGISDVVGGADNVVSMGVVKGSKESRSFWKTYSSSRSRLYGLKDIGPNSDNVVVDFVMNESDGQYHIDGGDHELVRPLLNDHAKSSGFSHRWDKHLSLRKPIVIHVGGLIGKDIPFLSSLPLEECEDPQIAQILKYHLFKQGSALIPENEIKESTIIEENVTLIPHYLITVDGEASAELYVEAKDTKYILGEVASVLKPFIGSEEFVIGDSDFNCPLNGDEEVKRDYHVIVMKRNVVAIDFDGTTLGTEVKVEEFAESLSELTGIDKSQILVKVEVNEEGFAIRVLVYLSDMEKAQDTANSVNNIVADGQCKWGMLCRNGGAIVLMDMQTLSGGVIDSSINVSMLLCLILLVVMN